MGIRVAAPFMKRILLIPLLILAAIYLSIPPEKRSGREWNSRERNNGR